MSIKPIVQKRVSDEVLDQIKEHIISGEWTPGMKIPGEMELTGLFGVSRVSIREAINRLVGMGVLSIRRGEGTYVTEILPKDSFNALLPFLMIGKASLKEMLEFRAMVEIESARLAAIRATKDDIGRMKGILDNMEKCQGNYKKFAAEDLNFHTALSLATQNSVVVKVNAIIHDMLRTAMEEIVSQTGFKDGLYYHGRILDAIIARNEREAVEVMKEHINVTIQKVGDPDRSESAGDKTTGDKTK
jgi:GntR family transcriptional repressor for pyruvate dehydrogenase complex